MKHTTRAMLTMVPAIFSSALLAMTGWIASVPNPDALRWAGAPAAIFVIWLWSDWLIHRAKTEQP